MFDESVVIIVKWLLVGGLVFYCGFAVVLMMQIKVMTETFESEVNPWMKLLGIAHLLAAILIVATAIVIL